MKCCGSPLISGAPIGLNPRTAATAALQAVVFGEILKPLAKTLGPVGDLAVESVAQHLFMRPRA
jgi:hypothetical protein